MPEFRMPKTTKGELNTNSVLKDKDRDALLRCQGILTVDQAAKAFDLNVRTVKGIWARDRASWPKDLSGAPLPREFEAIVVGIERERQGMPKELKITLYSTGKFNHVYLSPELVNTKVRVAISNGAPESK